MSRCDPSIEEVRQQDTRRDPVFLAPYRAVEKRGYRGSSLSCPGCRESARFVGYRARVLQSLLGTIRLHRAYYHCRHCGRGTIPWDDALHLGPQALTPGAAEVVSLAGALDSFAEAGSLALRKMAGLSASESPVERVSEATGRDIGRRQADGEVFGPPRP